MAGEIVLPLEIFSAKINEKLMTQAVRVYLANQRQGTASSKDRGEVSGSTKKIYRQKGTGRARHGSRKAPIFIGGGVVFGPNPRDYSLKLPKKARRLALFSALTAKFSDKAIFVIKGLEKIKGKTKEMIKTMENLKFKPKEEKILLLVSGEVKNVVLAGRNIENLKIAPARLLNTYEVLAAQKILFMEETIKVLQETYGEN